MNVTDAIIRDLHVLVQAGEASADTSALVDAWLAEHPALADELKRADAWRPEPVVPLLPQATELRALRRTKTLLAWRSWSMGLGFLFSGLPLSFEGDSSGVHFLLLPAHVGLAMLSLGIGLAAWIVFVNVSRALRPAGF
jgi:hypothetical protein